MKTTKYFRHKRHYRDRCRILDCWIQQAIDSPVAEKVQIDGRIRRWTWIAEEKKYLRVVLLADGETVHNAFFDRNYREDMQ